MPHAAPYGALVISLDFELHWGVRDLEAADGGYRRSLLGVWSAIPQMLRVFGEYGVAATWATVGFLFARDSGELRRYSPAIRPQYSNPLLDPYREPVGEDERSDPLHFAPSLIAQVQAAPRQEIGTHTFSHYYCLEAGQTRAEFRADLRAASAIMRTHGITVRSVVFPRNQHNPTYDGVLKELNVAAYRGAQRTSAHRARSSEDDRLHRRASRLADSYLGTSGAHVIEWSSIPQSNGLCDVAGTIFLRPYSPRLRHLELLRRRQITQSICDAARRNAVVHIWWHPHNFGRNTAENIAFLRSWLDVYAACRERYDMRSLTMAEAADAAVAALRPAK